MFDQETLAKEVKQQSQQIAVTSKLMTMLALGTAVKAGAAGLGAQYDSIVADAATNNVPKVAIIPQALIDLEEKEFHRFNSWRNCYQYFQSQDLPKEALLI